MVDATLDFIHHVQTLDQLVHCHGYLHTELNGKIKTLHSNCY